MEDWQRPDAIVLLAAIGLVITLSFVAIFYHAAVCKRDKRLLAAVTEPNRGTEAERKLVSTLLKLDVSPHAIFHDLYVKYGDGKYTQIDLVVPTKVGIFVFEVKDYSGWIYGKGMHREWTQVLAYGDEKYRFYNPVLQNNNHIAALRKQLKQFEWIPFYSIVVFYGDCELKSISSIPEGTYVIKADELPDLFYKLIDSNSQAKYTNKKEILAVLKQAVRNGTCEEIKSRHLEYIRRVKGQHNLFA